MTSKERTLLVFVSILSLNFLVSGNSFGNPSNQTLQKMQIAPNMRKPSHQFPTQALSLLVSVVWTPSSTNVERNREIKTKPSAAPVIIMFKFSQQMTSITILLRGSTVAKQLKRWNCNLEASSSQILMSYPDLTL